MMRPGLGIALTLGTLAGCGNAPLRGDDKTPVILVSAVSAPSPARSAPPPDASTPPPSAAKQDVLVGPLRTSKGNPVVEGRFLPIEAVQRRFGDNWQQLVGFRMRVTGTKSTYVCEPQEQCLLEGQIPLLRDVTLIELCETGWSLPAAAGPTVPCPPTAVEVERCVAECHAKSKKCSALPKSGPPDRGTLRRCGCKRVSCESRCRRYAEVDFACR